MLHKISTPILVAILLYHSYQYYAHSNTLENYAAHKGYTKKHSDKKPKYMEPQVVKVTNEIYVANGYALGNSIMVIGETAVVIIDTTESINQARIIANEFRKITKKPVVGIVYTHNHIDHVHGTEAFLENTTNRNQVEIWAHHSFYDIYFHSTRRVGKAHFYRSMHQFGVFLPEDLKSAGISSKLDVKRDMGSKLVQPNRLLYKEKQTINIAGIDLVLMHVPGETDDHICVYWPDKNALLGTDNLYKAFPNLYAIRGTTFRNIKQWYDSLDKMRDLRPDYFVMSHHLPLIGKEKVYRTMTFYRDAVQLVHDQTVRFINQGMHPDDIAARIKLPKQLQDHPYLQELYGTVHWSSKGLFAGYMGWFSGEISELDPLTPSEKAARIVKLAGGIEQLLKTADVALNENDTKWALFLSSQGLKVNPLNAKAKEIKAKALIDMAELQTSFNGYNYYKTAAYTTLGKVEIKLGVKQQIAAVKRATIKELFYLMSLRFKSESCPDVDKLVEFEFPDIKENVKFHIRNGVVDLSGVYEESRDVDVHVTVDSVTWKSVLIKEKSLDEINVKPNVNELRLILSCFE